MSNESSIESIEEMSADNYEDRKLHIESIPDLNDNSFAQFQLPPVLFTNLVKMGFNRPTPVQEQAIPFALEGRDILGSAQTGTGKTAAFAIPVVARLMEDPSAAALIMTPTRELAAQIIAVIHQLLGATRKNGAQGIRTALLIGGESMGRQFDQLRSSPRIVVGTPGRINDHLRRDGAMLEDVKMVILDEADRMLDMGFSGQIDDVLNHVQKPCQMLMFSATFPPAIVKFSKTYLNNPQRISITPENKTAQNIKQETVHTSDAEKYNTLVKELDARTGSIIVFVRTKHGADRLATRLAKENHSADAIHGDLRQRQRDRAIESFRNRKTRIMVATDVAARGIDVPHIEHVINYDLPQVAEDYVHRIGRTARAGAQGTALPILVPSDSEKWTMISRILDPTAGRQKTGEGGGAYEGKGKGKGRSNHRKGGSSFGGKSSFGKPSYRKEGGFNERKAGEGYSSKKREGGAYEGKSRTERSYGFRKEREEGEQRPRFDREDRPQRNDRPQGGQRFERNNEDRPQRKEFKGRRDGSQRFEGGKEGGERSDRNFRGESHDRFGRKERGERSDFRGNREGGDRTERGSDRGGYKGNRDGNRSEQGNARFSKDRGDRFEKNDKRSDREFRGGDFRDGQKPRGKSFGGKSEGRSYGDKPRGDKPYGERSEGRSFGDKPRGKSFDGKPEGRSFGDKPRGDKPYGDRSEGKSFGDKPRGKSFGGKSEGRAFGGKPGGGKSFGGGKKFGGKDGGSRRGAGRHQGGGKQAAR